MRFLDVAILSLLKEYTEKYTSHEVKSHVNVLIRKKRKKNNHTQEWQNGRNGNLSHLASYTVNPAMIFNTYTKPGKNETQRHTKINIV